MTSLVRQEMSANLDVSLILKYLVAMGILLIHSNSFASFQWLQNFTDTSTGNKFSTITFEGNLISQDEQGFIKCGMSPYGFRFCQVYIDSETGLRTDFEPI